MQDGRGGDGGPRSAIAWSPRSLRERVRPELRLETPPRMAMGRAAVSGHRAELRHEATLEEDWDRPRGDCDENRREGAEHRHRTVPGRCEPCVSQGHAVTGEEYHIVPTVEANGNKPISPLSVSAEPRCAR